jgi:hypothetical protein
MIDVIVCVMTYPPDMTGKTADEQRRAYQRGDIVSIYASDKLPHKPNLTIRANGTGPGRLRYIRLSGVPETFEQVKSALTVRVDHDNDPTTPGRSWWKGDSLILLANWPDRYAELRDTGVISMTWEEAKTILKNHAGDLITDADIVTPKSFDIAPV